MASLTNTARLYGDASEGVESYTNQIRSALPYLEKFLEEKKMAKLDALPATTLVTQDFFNEIATFLTVVKQLKRNTNEGLSQGSFVTFFSHIKVHIKKKFPHPEHDPDFWEVNDLWFQDIVCKAKRKMAVACMEGGMAIDKKAPPLGREQMKELCRACCRYVLDYVPIILSSKYYKC
jgi:hypothetical protein